MTPRSSSRAGARRTPRVLDGGRALELGRLPVVGEGGEAVIYALGDGRVAKVFKRPDHADFAADPALRDAVEARLREHQGKLAAFPKGVPPRLVAPSSLLLDEDGEVVGYAMPHVRGAELLVRYGERSFREGRVPDAVVTALFRDLRDTLTAAHRAGIVVGDLNELNVLVRGAEAYLVDADSMQFGGWLCRVYTERFLDPRLADPAAPRPVLVRPYDEDADWYAFTCLLMQSLLYVGPYGGVHRPRSASAKVPHDARPLRGISVFHPDVRYPKPARPWSILPDALLEHLRAVFERGARGPFPRALLDGLHWTTCSGCGAAHARVSCPACRTAVPVRELPVERVRGTVTATRVARAPGPILAARYCGERLLWLAAGPDGLVREDGARIPAPPAGGRVRARLRPGATLVATAERLVGYRGGAPEREIPLDPLAGPAGFDANDRHVYWLAEGALWRDDATGPERIGEVARGLGSVWVGPTFGFGFYRVGELTIAYVFDARARGLNDGVRLPRMGGQLVSARAHLSERWCWLATEAREGGRVVRRLAVVAADGSVVADASAVGASAEPWWEGLERACAAGAHLFVPTEEGIVRVTVEDGVLRTTAEFPDAEPFVSGGQRLMAGPGGLYAIGGAEIVRLEIR